MVQKMKNLFSRKMHAHAIGRFFSGYYQKMRKVMFFKLVRISFEKQVSEERKK